MVKASSIAITSRAKPIYAMDLWVNKISQSELCLKLSTKTNPSVNKLDTIVDLPIKGAFKGMSRKWRTALQASYHFRILKLAKSPLIEVASSP